MTAVAATGIRARTRALPSGPTESDLLDALDRDGFVWRRDGLVLVASGVRWVGAGDDPAVTLAAIPHDDPLARFGTGPLAVGALPFAAGPDDPATLLAVPTWVMGIDEAGAWRTELELPPGTARWTPRRGRSVGTTTRAHWDEMVTDALAVIDDGPLEKVVLARALATGPAATRSSILRRLVRAQPGCFVFADADFLGATPELLVRRRDRTVQSCPMAGTTTVEELEQLRSSAKDANEHRVVVDAVTAALRRTCDPVSAPSHPDVAAFANYAHLVTEIEGTLRAGTDPSVLDLVRGLHPTPAVAGTPTDDALALIGKLEDFDRGRYAGPVGWMDARGDGEFAIALRCAELDGPSAVAYAGAGIVAGSTSASEWDETDAKLAVMLEALQP